MNSNAPERRQHERRYGLLQEASEWLVRLQDDDCTDAELEAWGRWMQASPQHAAAFDDVSALWDASAKLDSAAVLSARERTIHRTRDRVAGVRRRHSWPLRLAAGIAATLLATAGAYFVVSNPSQEIEAQVVRTSIGERRHLTLSDGSTLDLDAGSEVLVRYAQKGRDVELRTGQAYFSVAHASDRPFIVTAGTLRTRAIGTRFAVSHRANRSVAVTVAEGRVRVSNADEPGGATLAVDAVAGQQVTFSQDVGLQAAQAVNSELTTAWREGVVIYQGEPLANVIADLNRYSLLAVRLEDPALGQLKVTGRWEVAATDRWVEGLARATGTRVRRNADEILLTRETEQKNTDVSPNKRM